MIRNPLKDVNENVIAKAIDDCQHLNDWDKRSMKRSLIGKRFISEQIADKVELLDIPEFYDLTNEQIDQIVKENMTGIRPLKEEDYIEFNRLYTDFKNLCESFDYFDIDTWTNENRQQLNMMLSDFGTNLYEAEDEDQKLKTLYSMARGTGSTVKDYEDYLKTEWGGSLSPHIDDLLDKAGSADEFVRMVKKFEESRNQKISEMMDRITGIVNDQFDEESTELSYAYLYGENEAYDNNMKSDVIQYFEDNPDDDEACETLFGIRGTYGDDGEEVEKGKSYADVAESYPEVKKYHRRIREKRNIHLIRENNGDLIRMNGTYNNFYRKVYESAFINDFTINEEFVDDNGKFMFDYMEDVWNVKNVKIREDNNRFYIQLNTSMQDFGKMLEDLKNKNMIKNENR